MDPLDFSHLTDDQLVGLLRAILRECVERGGGVRAAAESAGLDEAERMNIAREAAEREAAKLRAQERERVAREAAAAVRRQHDEQEAAAQTAANRHRQNQEAEAEEARRAASVETGRIAAQKLRVREQQEMNWVRRAAAILEVGPETIDLLLVDTNYGRRVLINETKQSRWTRDHLADWHIGSSKIKTIRAHVGCKADLIAFCAEFAAIYPHGELYLEGCDYTFSEEEKCPAN